MDDVEIIVTGVSSKGEVKVDNNRPIREDEGDAGGTTEESSERNGKGENL